MLRLSREQFDLLEQIVLKRHAASIAAVLAETWPELPERLQARWPAFVEAAVQQGRKAGFDEARGLARYASLWCILGPAFDSKPTFAWAGEILANPGLSADLKLHQLAHRAAGDLRERQAAAARATPTAAVAAPLLTPAQFESALAKVDHRMATLAAARAVFPSAEKPLLRKACDIGSIDMLIAEAEGLQEYTHSSNGWRRVALSRTNDLPVKWLQAPAEPVQMSLTSHGLRGGLPSRVNLRIDTIAVCDMRVHPEVVQLGPEGRIAWKGRDAARLSLALYAPSAAAAGPAQAGPMGIAFESPAETQTIAVASGGWRDTGAPFGDVSLRIQVYPATQWLSNVSHAAWQMMAWPAPAGVALPAPGAVCRLEQDGAAVDVAVWQRAWGGLHGAFRAGLDRLYQQWARVLDGQAPRLEVEASPLVGQAGIAWGWRRTTPSTVLMRTQGVLDMLALSIELRLNGELVEGSTRSSIRIHCKGRSELRGVIAQLGAEATESQGLKSAVRSWRFPFLLEVGPIAGPDAATLGAAAVAVPITGALVGECGLRLRADGGGHQWFFAMRVEPVSVVCEQADPVLGLAQISKSIFPAMALVDWSAG